MLLSPKSLQELQASLEDARQKRQRIRSVVLDAFTQILEHNPEDMTVRVQAGITLEALQVELWKRGQWLPIDPPKARRVSIAALLQENLSGPRRYGYGTIREHLIGLTAMLPDGKVIKSGGRVVKNVAGYDLQKIFVGSHGTLGIILEAIFKLRPLPESEQFWEAAFPSLAEASLFVRKILDSPVEPIVLDLRRSPGTSFVVVAGFAGTREEVEWQNGILSSLGPLAPSNLKYEEEFWSMPESVQKLAVLPTDLGNAIEEARPSQFVARAGNGVLYCRGGNIRPKSPGATDLAQRIKDTFDPNHLLPDLPP